MRCRRRGDGSLSASASEPSSPRPWWRRRRWIVLASLVLLLVAIRVALPHVLRRVIESQASSFLAGTVTVADVDLSLLQGAVEVHGFELIGDAATDAPAGAPAGAAPAPDAPVATDAALAPEESAAQEAENAAAAPLPSVVADASGAAGESAAPRMPRVAFRRLLVDVSWRPLFSRTVVIDEVALDGPEVDVERLRDGTVVLPQLRPSAVAEPVAEEPPAEEPAAPWNVIVTAARLKDGKLLLDDQLPEPPRKIELSLDGLELFGFRLLHDAKDEEPGKGTIEARFGDGTVKLETSLATRAEGFAVMATVTLDNVPLDRLNLHAPELGWSDFRGRLDGKIDVHLEPDGLPIVWGTAALRDVQVDVPDLNEPALAWRRFEVVLERLDVAKRSAAIERVALEGAGALVRPLANPPLPLLNGLMRASATVDTPVATPAAAPTPVAPPPGQEPAAADAPVWSWSVGTVTIADSMARIFLVPPPLELGIAKLEVKGLSSAPGGTTQVAAELSEGGSRVTLAGDVVLAPLGAKLQLGLTDLALERYATAVGVTPPVLRRGRLGGDLKLAFGNGPATASGQVRLADLDVAPPEGEEFAVAWRELAIGIGEIRVPGVPPSEESPATGPVSVKLTRIALAAPRVRLTRTADGLVVPAVRVELGDGGAVDAADADAVAAAEGAAPSATPAAAPSGELVPSPTTVAAERSGADTSAAATDASTPPPVELSIDELKIEDGEVAVLDRTVQPFFRGSLTAIALDVRGFSFPEPRFREVTLTAKAPDGSPLEVRAQQKGKVLEVTADTKGLALPQLNPYVTGASGYSISSGKFTLTAKARLDDAGGYQTESRLAFDDLDVAGAAGDSLFAERFGVSLSLALALLRDVSGRIALTVPVSGDSKGGARPDLAPIVAEALSRALINALASPLKLLGALSLDGEKVTAFAPEPIGFVVGKADIDDDAWWRIDQLTGVLAASPALRVELTGEAGPEDLRALQEAAVLADLDSDQGFLGTLRNLPSRGTRNAVKEALAARAKGEPGTLDEEQGAQLDEWIAAKGIGEAELKALATARAERLRDVLASDYGLGTDRVVLQDGVTTGDAAKSQVAVKLGARE